VRQLGAAGFFGPVAFVEVGLRDTRVSERFSSSDLAGLKYVNGFGELPGLPGTAAEFAQDAPGFELGVGAFAGAGQLGVKRGWRPSAR